MAWSSSNVSQIQKIILKFSKKKTDRHGLTAMEGGDSSLGRLTASQLDKGTTFCLYIYLIIYLIFVCISILNHPLPPPSYCLKKNYLCWPHQGHAGWCIPRSTHMDLVPANISYLTFDTRLTWTICPFMHGNQTVRHVIYWMSDFNFKTHRRSAGHRLPSGEKNIQIGQKRNCALRDIFKGKLVV